jgi:sortase (surface protein transpeptidase)
VKKRFYKIGLIALLVGGFSLGNAALAQNAANVVPAGGFVFTRNLSIGAQGNDVSALQQFLIAGGYLKISTSTGYFGSATMAALGAWQASVGIFPQAGYFGPLSRAKINELAQSTSMNVTSTQRAIATTTIMVETTSPPVASGTIGLPARLIIPKLDIDANFQDTGLKPDGTMEVPSTIYVVGWFTGSVRPGEKGVAIITGHIAQVRGGVVTKPGVFSNLSTLVVGDTLSVVDDKGASVTFAVRAVRSYDPTADATDVFTSTDHGAHLNIITCEGTWVQSQLSYTERLVVFTDKETQ